MVNDVTLREAFYNFHRKNNLIVSETELANDSEVLFNCHDIAHVIRPSVSQATHTFTDISHSMSTNCIPRLFTQKFLTRILLQTGVNAV
jgi:hypothetical protein